MTIEVYSKPNCVQCTQTKKTMDKLSLEYKVVDLMEDADAFKYVTEQLGHRAAPVVVIKDNNGKLVDSWAGFRPEKIEELS
jgi:glutaredoxin-like protein NrdH